MFGGLGIEEGDLNIGWAGVEVVGIEVVGIGIGVEELVVGDREFEDTREVGI